MADQDRETALCVTVFAEVLGVDSEELHYPELREVAKELLFNVPDGWEVVIGQSEHEGIPMFHNKMDNTSQWNHPLEKLHAQTIIAIREDLISSSTDNGGATVSTDNPNDHNKASVNNDVLKVDEQITQSPAAIVEQDFNHIDEIEVIFAQILGIDTQEKHAYQLIFLAKELLHTLPDGWEVVSGQSDLGVIPYFFNTVNQQSYWSHPYEEECMHLIHSKRDELMRNDALSANDNSEQFNAAKEEGDNHSGDDVHEIEVHRSLSNDNNSDDIGSKNHSIGHNAMSVSEIEPSEGLTELDILFASVLGVDVDNEAHSLELCFIAKTLLYELPDTWDVSVSVADGIAGAAVVPVFYDNETQTSHWEHPYEASHKQRIIEARQLLQAQALSEQEQGVSNAESNNNGGGLTPIIEHTEVHSETGDNSTDDNTRLDTADDIQQPAEESVTVTDDGDLAAMLTETAAVFVSRVSAIAVESVSRPATAEACTTVEAAATMTSTSAVTSAAAEAAVEDMQSLLTAEDQANTVTHTEDTAATAATSTTVVKSLCDEALDMSTEVVYELIVDDAVFHIADDVMTKLEQTERRGEETSIDYAVEVLIDTVVEEVWASTMQTVFDFEIERDVLLERLEAQRLRDLKGDDDCNETVTTIPTPRQLFQPLLPVYDDDISVSIERLRTEEENEHDLDSIEENNVSFDLNSLVLSVEPAEPPPPVTAVGAFDVMGQSSNPADKDSQEKGTILSESGEGVSSATGTPSKTVTATNAVVATSPEQTVTTEGAATKQSPESQSHHPASEAKEYGSPVDATTQAVDVRHQSPSRTAFDSPSPASLQKHKQLNSGSGEDSDSPHSGDVSRGKSNTRNLQFQPQSSPPSQSPSSSPAAAAASKGSSSSPLDSLSAQRQIRVKTDYLKMLRSNKVVDSKLSTNVTAVSPSKQQLSGGVSGDDDNNSPLKTIAAAKALSRHRRRLAGTTPGDGGGADYDSLASSPARTGLFKRLAPVESICGSTAELNGGQSSRVSGAGRFTLQWHLLGSYDVHKEAVRAREIIIHLVTTDSFGTILIDPRDNFIDSYLEQEYMSQRQERQQHNQSQYMSSVADSQSLSQGSTFGFNDSNFSQSHSQSSPYLQSNNNNNNNNNNSNNNNSYSTIMSPSVNQSTLSMRPELIIGRMKSTNEKSSKIRIRRDVGRMQWVVETDDKAVKKIVKRHRKKGKVESTMLDSNVLVKKAVKVKALSPIRSSGEDFSSTKTFGIISKLPESILSRSLPFQRDPHSSGYHHHQGTLTVSDGDPWASTNSNNNNSTEPLKQKLSRHQQQQQSHRGNNNRVEFDSGEQALSLTSTSVLHRHSSESQIGKLPHIHKQHIGGRNIVSS